MRPRRYLLLKFFKATLLNVLWICATSTAWAQAAEDVAAYRAKLVEFSAGMEQALQQYLEQDSGVGVGDPYHLRERQLLRSARDAFVRARYVIPAVSDADVIRMREGFARAPQVFDLPRSWSQQMQTKAVPKAEEKALAQTAPMVIDTSAACSGDQYSDTSGGALPVYGLDFAWATQFLNMFLNLFTQYPDYHIETPKPGSVQLIPTFTAYQGGQKGASQCEQAQALLDLLYEMIPEAIADVSIGVGISVGVEVQVSVGKDIPSPIKQGFGILSSVNKLICLRMALANNLGNDCSLRASFNAIDSRIQGIGAAVAGDIAAHDAKLVAHDLNMATQHAALTSLINTRANAIDAALQAQKEFLERFRGLTVRLALEKNLLDDGNDVMSIFQVPSEPSAPGGSDGVGIALVRQIVEAAIARSKAAGLPVFQAESELAKGTAAAAKADYREAFSHFRQAYLNAVK